VIGGLNLWLTMIFISFFFGTMSWWFAFARNRGDQQGDSLDKK
jgi:cbb3-type cytochrome oxidase subunit 3